MAQGIFLAAAFKRNVEERAGAIRIAVFIRCQCECRHIAIASAQTLAHVLQRNAVATSQATTRAAQPHVVVGDADKILIIFMFESVARFM